MLQKIHVESLFQIPIKTFFDRNAIRQNVLAKNVVTKNNIKLVLIFNIINYFLEISKYDNGAPPNI